jgi:hypothetical protein
MSYLALGLTAVSVGTSIYGANQAGKAGKAQAAGEARRQAALLRLFGQRDPGAAQLEGLMGLAEFDINVNPLDFQDAGFGLTSDAMDFLRNQAELTFNQTVGPQNLGTFNAFLSDNLERANFDFSSLPKEITRTLEGSALSRAVGGPAGLAENLSVENKLRLQQQSESSAFRALAFRQGFQPDLINPIQTTMDLAKFEQQSQIAEAGIQLSALNAAANIETSRFALEAGYQPPNFAGVDAMASASMANAVSQGAATLGMAYGSYAGRQQQPQQPQQPAGATSSAQVQPTADWRYSASGGSANSQNPYLRG